MAAAGLIQAATLDLIAAKIRPGVSTQELDEAAERFIRSQGATPTFKGYRGFPGSICASPNSMIVHGIPGRYRLERGDILSVDIGVTFEGWVADAARTFAVGDIPPLAQNPWVYGGGHGVSSGQTRRGFHSLCLAQSRSHGRHPCLTPLQPPPGR